MKKGLIAVLVLLTALAAFLSALAEDSSAQWEKLFVISGERDQDYSEISEAWNSDPQTYCFAPEQAVIELLPEDAKLTGDARLIGNNGSYGALLAQQETNPYLISTGSAESLLEWTIEVEFDGIYELQFNYLCLGGNETKIQRRLRIDGRVPYEEANNLCLYRAFREEVQEDGKMRVNAIGDEVWPHQTELRLWQTARAVDQQAIYVDPLRFYLTEGTHTVSLEYVDQPVVLGKISFLPPRTYPSYAERLEQWKQKAPVPLDADICIKIQGENSAWRSENVIRRESDSDPLTEPRSGISRVLNVVGGYRWRLGNAAVTWQVEIGESGLYTISVKALQNVDPGMPSYRQISIDGEIPFDEMRLYSFPYDSNWYGETLHAPDGTPYCFYLEEGVHTITASVKLGPIGEIMQRTEKDVTYLGRVQREIVKITGTDPDYNYEYDLYRTMPELSGQLSYLSGRLSESADLLKSISSETTSMENNFHQIIDQLNFFAEDVDRIPRALSDLDNAQTNLGTYISSIEKCPLSVDYLILTSPENTVDVDTSNLWQRFKVTAENFAGSFTKDYDSVGLIVDEKDDTDYQVLNVWIARGTEWGEILKDLADEDFTPRTGIVVNLHVLPSGQLSTGSINTILLSVASGTAPDVALSVEYNLPNEFAFREAAVDLSKFADYEQVASRFYASSMIPYQYKGGVYALPETMDFTVMVYRRDILSELGVELPETWTDMYQKVLPRLYEQSMSFSMPVDTSVSSNSPGALRGFTMLLLQMGGAYYRDGGAMSALDTPEAYSAFKTWTDLYANYGIDEESNFFTRIRTGTTPIGIGNYTMYLQLLTSAPELYGRWSISPVPGTVQADGRVLHTVGTTASTANMILSQSTKQEAAWEFLKWWTSEDVQARYGRELEAILGTGARWNTANVNAFFALPWDLNDEKVIRAMLDAAEEQLIVPGGYFTGRHIINAWNRVVINNENARDALEKAVKDINKELRNKRQEFGLE